MASLFQLALSRRRFLKSLGIWTAAAVTLLRGGDVRAAVDVAAAESAPPDGWPKMPRRPLGQTGFMASPLVFGCGAALARRRRDSLLDAALEAGVNVFDVGHRAYYRGAEKNLAPFLAKHRDEVFLISKGLVGLDLDPGTALTSGKARQGAATWQRHLDESLSDLGVEQVDAYYVMAANNPALIESDEILAAAKKAKEAGKIRFLGLSCHQNQQRVLEAAMRTGEYGLAMIAVTPAGWYDWNEKAIARDTQPMAKLQPFLARVRKAGIGLVGMKAGRYIAGSRFTPWSRPEAFDEYYGEALREASLSAFQRSYAYVLAHGLDVVNADMQSLPNLRENVIAAARSESFFA